MCQGRGLLVILGIFFHPQTSQDGKFGKRGSGRSRKNFQSHSETISINILVWKDKLLAETVPGSSLVESKTNQRTVFWKLLSTSLF